MRNVRFSMVLPAALWLAAAPIALAAQGEGSADKDRSVSFFDVLDLPARIDEPKLRQNGDRYLLKCAVANRSSEQLLGLRLILMIVGSDGKLRVRLNWSEESAVAPASINTFELHPPIKDKDKVQNTDRVFLAVDEAIGRETIWRVVDAERGLRAYSRGQLDVMPKVRTVANKHDREFPVKAIPLENKR